MSDQTPEPQVGPNTRPRGKSARNHPIRTLDSVQLLQGDREIHIHHRGEVYRLLETRNGKLILQK